MLKYAISCLVIFGGLFSLFCAAKDYEWFMESRKAKRVAMFLGRKGARIFYMLFGACLAGGGVVLLVGAFTGKWRA